MVESQNLRLRAISFRNVLVHVHRLTGTGHTPFTESSAASARTKLPQEHPLERCPWVFSRPAEPSLHSRGHPRREGRAPEPPGSTQPALLQSLHPPAILPENKNKELLLCSQQNQRGALTLLVNSRVCTPASPRISSVQPF